MGRATFGTYVDHTTHQVVRIQRPTCPTCGSTGKQCLRPSGHGASEWHVARELLLAPLIGWPDYQPGDRCTDTACMDAAEAAGL